MGPFIRSNNDTKKLMRNVLIALIPIIIFAIYKNGFIPFINGQSSFVDLIRPLMFIIVGSFTSFLVELLYYKLIKKTNEFKNTYGFFPGLFLSLILPFKTPIYILIIGCVIATISKLVFGGFGKNIFNPALFGYMALIVIFSSVFSTNYYFNNYELDTMSSSTPLTNASMVSGIGSYEKLITPYGSLLNFFIGTIPGSFAETSSVLCLVALVYLIITKTIKWRIPTFYLLTVFVMTFSIGRLLGQGLYYPLFHLFSGGLMFGAVFMATDPVTSAVSPIGQILQGICLGILTVVFRFIGVEGVATSILIINMFVFIFDKIGVSARLVFMKILPWYSLLCIIIVVLIFVLASTKRVVGNQDPNFDIISKNKDNNTITYVVTQKGYGGKIKASIVIEDNVIKTIEILNHNETKDRYQLVIDSDYLNELIKNQSDIQNVDTISNATVTSNSLKKMILNVLNDYN